MELAGDLYKPFLGLVNQTGNAPVGRLIPWKMSKINTDPASDKVETPNNAVPNFKTSIESKRGTDGKMSQACFDPAFNIYGTNPFGPGFGITLREGMR